MRLEASAVAVVGDDAEADVAGAKKAGLTGIQVTTGNGGLVAMWGRRISYSIVLPLCLWLWRREMKISDIPVETGERYELVSITDEVRLAARDAGVDEGICIISSTHTTAAVTVNEDYDRDVTRDLASACRAFLDALDVRFQHAEGNATPTCWQVSSGSRRLS